MKAAPLKRSSEASKRADISSLSSSSFSRSSVPTGRPSGWRDRLTRERLGVRVLCGTSLLHFRKPAHARSAFTVSRAGRQQVYMLLTLMKDKGGAIITQFGMRSAKHSYGIQ